MMNFLARMVVYVGMTLVLCASLIRFAGTWFGEQGSALQCARVIAIELRRTQAFESRSKVYESTNEARQRVREELLGRRLRLREAIEQFQRINEQMIEALAREEVDQGMATDRLLPPIDPKGVAQHVLRWVRSAVYFWPQDKANRLLEDLESEFRELFGCSSDSDSWTVNELFHQDVSTNRVPRRGMR